MTEDQPSDGEIVPEDEAPDPHSDPIPDVDDRVTVQLLAALKTIQVQYSAKKGENLWKDEYETELARFEEKYGLETDGEIKSYRETDTLPDLSDETILKAMACQQVIMDNHRHLQPHYIEYIKDVGNDTGVDMSHV